MHVGLPCMKLSLAPSNQKHHGKAARTCSVKDAWAEMSDERRGRDETIDKSLTCNNVWITGSSDMDMESLIDCCVMKVNYDKKNHGKRALRSDAVTGIEMIEKPPLEYMEKLPRDEQELFLRDSGRVVDSILYDWNPEWKTAAQVIHFDEFGGKSPHTHRIIIPMTKDKDGVLTFNAKEEFNLKFFTFVNSEYPKRMRELGYEVEDCRIYEQMTEEQKEEHQKNKPEYGLEGFEFKRKKNQELDEQIRAKQVEITEKEQIISTRDAEIKDKDRLLNEKNKQISDKDAEILIRTDKIDQINERGRKLAEKNKSLKHENKDLKINILTSEQVKKLPEPQKNLTRRMYQIPIDRYNALIATASEVNYIKETMVSENKRFNEWEQSLIKREVELDRKQKLPTKEKMELLVLRKLKESIIWLVKLLPATSFRHLLERALMKEDLTQYKSIEEAELKDISHRSREFQL